MVKYRLDFSGKVVLITGSTAGIGWATAELFAERGATVIVNGRDKENVKTRTRELLSRGYRAEGVAADVSRKSDLAMLLRKIGTTYGRLDVLVNNAGVRTPFINEAPTAISRQSWDKVFDTNVAAAFFAAQRSSEIMKRSGGGIIINMASYQAAWGSYGHGAHYIASKGALISLTRVLAMQFRDRGIRVNAIVPSQIATRYVFSREQQKEYEIAVRTSLFGREGLPVEVGAVCLFLASEMASAITGEIISVGGYQSGTYEL